MGLIPVSELGIRIPIGKLKGKMKYDIIAVKSVTKRGGSWQVTVPKEVVSSLNLEESKLAFIKLEGSKGMVFLLLRASAFTIL